MTPWQRRRRYAAAMRSAFVLMVVAGTGLGLLLPGAKRPAAAPAQEAALVATPQSKALAGQNPDWNRDTILTRERNGHFYATAEVNGQPVRFVVDTGASIVALTEDDARRIGVAFDPTKYEVVAEGAGGPVRGQRVRLNEVRLDGKSGYDLGAVVLEGATVSLLGQNYLRTVSVAMDGERMVLK